MKRILDFALAVPSLTALLIPFAVIALFVKVNSSGTVLFCQERADINGRLLEDELRNSPS